MAKQKKKVEESEYQRTSRKEELRARKQAEQLRNVRLGVIIVGALLVAVIAFALVNEYVLSPSREIATVGAQAITLKEFQDRVRFERAQRIITLNDQLEMFNDDVGLVQQFSAQAINELQSSEALGEAALNTMAQSLLIRQALAERGGTVTEEEIDQRISESFNFFGGESPTPVPTATDAPEPTPSLTPVGFIAPEEEAETTVEEDVAAEEQALPTATPVSEESFRQEFDDFIAGFEAFGVSEAAYRTLVGDVIASEKLADLLAEEQGLERDDMHASAFVLIAPTEEQLEETRQAIADSDFLTVWNTAASAVPDPEQEDEPVRATEILWQTSDAIAQQGGSELASAIFATAINEVSDAISVTGSDGATRYYLVMPSGREVRPLSEAEYENRKITLLAELIDSGMAQQVNIGEYWRSRVPSVPVLNPKFLQAATPTPVLPVDEATDTDLELPLVPSE